MHIILRVPCQLSFFLPLPFLTEAYCCPWASVQLPPISVPCQPLWPSSSTPWGRPSNTLKETLNCCLCIFFSWGRGLPVAPRIGSPKRSCLLSCDECTTPLTIHHGHIIADAHKLCWCMHSLADRWKSFLKFDGIQMRNWNPCSWMRWKGISFFACFLIIYWLLYPDIFVFSRIVQTCPIIIAPFWLSSHLNTNFTRCQLCEFLDLRSPHFCKDHGTTDGKLIWGTKFDTDTMVSTLKQSWRRLINMHFYTGVVI